MKREELRGISPVPWVLVALLVVILAGLVLLRLLSAGTPAPEPTASAAAETVTPVPEPDEAEKRLAEMTLREKLCQLMIVKPQMLVNRSALTAVDDTLREAMKEYPVAGFLLAGEHIKTAEQLSALTRDLQRAGDNRLMLAVDEEGGRVARLMTVVGTTPLKDMYSYRNEGTKTAYQNAWTLAQDLRRFGFNTDFAPVADVWSVKENDVIGNRAYSDDYDQAAELIASAVHGFRDGGVLCALKHFPGHGSTTTDSHVEAADVRKTLDQLKKQDLKPFAAGIEAGADMVMVGHLTVKAADSVPATMSRAIMTDLLRGEMGFDGVIITDSLQMKAAGAWSDGEKAVKCLAAGADLLLEIEDVPGAVKALEQAVETGELSEARIDESVLRVLRMKLNRGIL